MLVQLVCVIDYLTCRRRRWRGAAPVLLAALTLNCGEQSSTSPRDDTGNPDAGDRPLQSVRVIRGAQANSYWDLTIRGVDLAQHEHRVVTVRIGNPAAPLERLGSGQARVSGGTFEVFFPQVWEAGLYKHKRAFIDVDGDGRCEPATDGVYDDLRGMPHFELTVHSTDEDSQFAMRFASDAAATCAALNADWPDE